MEGPVVIVGSGQAGFQVAASLRQDGFSSKIVMIGAEPGLPYQRPPLSKAFIKDGDGERLAFRAGDFFEKNAIALHDGIPAARIEPEARQVVLASGETIAYAHLVLATGARNRDLPIAGTSLSGVHALRTLADAEAIRSALGEASRLAVIGGGFIGLEIAATAASMGKAVTVFEGTQRLMSRVVSEPVSAFFLERHRKAGIDVRLDAFVRTIEEKDGRAAGVMTADGQHVEADMVLLAAGIVANTELAEGAGLYVHDGIRVDDFLLTENEHISAIGDCASFPFGEDGVHVRLESVQNAVDQAKCVSKRLTGTAERYDKVPWFWSDQGPYKLQITGLTAGSDHHEVMAGDGGKLSVFCFRRGELVGVETVNAPADHMASRKLMGTGRKLTLDTLQANGFSLQALMRG